MYRITLLCLVAACGASSLNEQQPPRGLRADQHLAVASREDDRARDLAHWPDSPPNGPAGDQRLIGGWSGTWDTVAEHHRLAMVHRSAAAQIEAEYEQACGDTPAAVASVSPLQRHGVGSSPIPGGTLMLLSPDAGPPDRLLSAMRCHRAWMMLGRSDMDDCPLDLPGLRIEAQGHDDAVELTITVADPTLVDELRRRAAHDLEAGQARRSDSR